MGNCSTTKKVSIAELTPEEISTVRDVWTKAKNGNVGKKILETLIEKRPKFAEYFGIVSSDSEGLDMIELVSNKQFQLQAHRIQNFLDTTVGSLGFCPIESVHDMAHRIGQIHFYKGVNFGADNWLVFKKVTVDQVTMDHDNVSQDQDKSHDTIEELAREKNSIARAGWNKLMMIVVREMKRGFLEEAMRNCKEEEKFLQHDI